MATEAEWSLLFTIEEGDEEAALRFRHIVATLQSDPHVRETEVSTNSCEPSSRSIRVKFLSGKSEPFTQEFKHLEKVYGYKPAPRKNRLLRILDEDFLGD